MAADLEAGRFGGRRMCGQRDGNLRDAFERQHGALGGGAQWLHLLRQLCTGGLDHEAHGAALDGQGAHQIA